MSRICELHDQAMDIMNEAIRLENTGKRTEAGALFIHACDLECESAFLVEKKPENEPSRGMLFLGAASLAKRIKDYERAERLVFEGLSGFPTELVREDLERLYDEIKFERNWDVVSPCLTGNQAIFRFLSGKSIGYGNIVSKTFTRCVDALDKLVFRSVQRMAGLNFEKHPKKHPGQPAYSLNIGLAEAGSFGFTISIVHESGQQLSLFANDPVDILQNILDNLYLVGIGEDYKVRENIPDDEYCANFVAQAKQILPDGDNVKMIGITSRKGSFKLDKTKRQLYGDKNKKTVNEEINSTESGLYKGYLKISDGIRNKFTLVLEDSSEIEVFVRDALDELAKQYFGDLVEIRCETKNNKPYLTDITSLA